MNEKANMRNKYGSELIGRKFGRLQILELSKAKGFAVCRCECGNVIEPKIHNLMTGNTTSCGCARSDNGRETSTKNFLENYKDMRKYGTNFHSIASSKARKDNTSGVKGVSYNGKKWIARITVQHHSVYLGSFQDIESAIAARKAGEEKYFKPLIERKIAESSEI